MKSPDVFVVAVLAVCLLVGLTVALIARDTKRSEEAAKIFVCLEHADDPTGRCVTGAIHRDAGWEIQETK